MAVYKCEVCEGLELGRPARRKRIRLQNHVLYVVIPDPHPRARRCDADQHPWTSTPRARASDSDNVGGTCAMTADIGGAQHAAGKAKDGRSASIPPQRPDKARTRSKALEAHGTSPARAKAGSQDRRVGNANGMQKDGSQNGIQNKKRRNRHARCKKKHKTHPHTTVLSRISRSVSGAHRLGRLRLLLHEDLDAGGGAIVIESRGARGRDGNGVACYWRRGGSGREVVAVLIAGADGNDPAMCAETNASRRRGGSEETKGRVDDAQVRR
ncbi:hypothetical protein B0H13DRAFT_1867185 [Mycena leptocephala]|nr:hypothetical protein B0H13DRAFT_1867185 [Mycena leptocephala]